MLALINGAERSVSLEGYIFRSDEVDSSSPTALIARSERE
jgi:hypothetical protein